ncbi:chromophore lyase CRL, chloroplastic-like isoform X2 [Chenopodium quinoa]|uniref:chromophore lyase CRL, chloroplastic-like isoform X2 n=1 Tax=Chenopodium quinoa TaxID=63459 RepID=UPI000B78BA35|nr:chromophore lyase CRL, chloroplastic-like isoform X2 [Chenopodium quinoa]
MGEGDTEPTNGGWSKASGWVIKTLIVVGGALFVRRLTKSTTRRDHARFVSHSLSDEKNSREQAARDPDHFFNLRMIACPAADMVDGSKVLYFEQAFWRTPQKPFRQRFYMLSTYAIRDMEEYKNFCDRSKDQRPLPEEVIRDIAEHLTTIHLKRCERGKRCLYEGKTPSEGFPNTWNNASYCKSELSVLKNNEIHMWDRGYDEDGNQVWGVKEGPYEFKPASTSSFKDMYSPANLLSPLSLDKRIEGSFVLQE